MIVFYSVLVGEFFACSDGEGAGDGGLRVGVSVELEDDVWVGLCEWRYF